MRKFFYSRLALRNIQKNGKFYFPYLLTCIGTIALFYIMGFLTYHPGIFDLRGGDILLTILGLGMIVVGIFAAIFLYYTNSFLMKRRQKEFGLFHILGMEKRHLARVMLYETIMIAIGALTLGIITGLAFSKLMLLLLCKITGIATSFVFYVSKHSISVTAICFGCIFSLILVSNLLRILRSKPIELLHGSNVGEKEPKTKWVLAVLGVLLTGSGYFIAQEVTSPVDALALFFVAVLLVIGGTFCLFTAGSIAVLKLLRKKKSYYYSPKHFISISGMIYRMKQNAAGLANICILSTMVLVIISTTVCLYIGMENQIQNIYPADYSINLGGNASQACIAAVREDAIEAVEQQGLTVTSQAEYEYLEFAVERKGEQYVAGEEMTSASGLAELVCIPVEDYNTLTGKNITLGDNQVVAYSPTGTVDPQFTLFGQTYTVKEEGEAFLAEGKFGTYIRNVFFLVVNRATFQHMYEGQLEAYQEYASNKQYVLYLNVDGTNTEKEAYINIVGQKVAQTAESYNEDGSLSVSWEDRVTGEKEGRLLYGGFLFLGIFLGSLFLMATVLIIYYKQMSEGYDDRARFEILKQVGMSRDEIWKTIRSQIISVFFLPLVMAAVHVAFAFKMITKLLSLFSLQNIQLFFYCTIGTFLAFAVIYSFVYRMTAKTYYRIVS